MKDKEARQVITNLAEKLEFTTYFDSSEYGVPHVKSYSTSREVINRLDQLESLVLVQREMLKQLYARLDVAFTTDHVLVDIEKIKEKS